MLFKFLVLKRSRGEIGFTDSQIIAGNFPKLKNEYRITLNSGQSQHQSRLRNADMAITSYFFSAVFTQRKSRWENVSVEFRQEISKSEKNRKIYLWRS